MLDLVTAVINLITGILALFHIHIDPQVMISKTRNKKMCAVGGVIVLLVILIIWAAHKQASLVVTQITLEENSMMMAVGDVRSLIATVIYSDNSIGNTVLWFSSDPSVADVDQNGQIIAVAEGIATISAQAVKNSSYLSAECMVTVKNPPGGYSISVHQISPGSCYAYIYVTPYDSDVTEIRIYGKSPSGEIYSCEPDENDFYDLYAECGEWVVYASLENEAGTYEASKPEDFVTIAVTERPPKGTGIWESFFGQAGLQ